MNAQEIEKWRNMSARASLRTQTASRTHIAVVFHEWNIYLSSLRIVLAAHDIHESRPCIRFPYMVKKFQTFARSEHIRSVGIRLYTRSQCTVSIIIICVLVKWTSIDTSRPQENPLTHTHSHAYTPKTIKVLRRLAELLFHTEKKSENVI